MKVSSLALLLLVCCTGCGYLVSLLPVEEPPTLPPATQEGAMTMGCLVNGEVLTASRKYGSSLGPQVSGSIDTFNNILVGVNDDREAQFLTIQFNPPVPPDSSLAVPARFYVWDTPSLDLTRLWIVANIPHQAETRIVMESPHNWIEFTRYEPFTMGIISGTFAFDMLSEEGDTIRIREGRFDVALGTR